MALNATICKVDLHLADNDRARYGSYELTVAQHPSETDERLMIRLLAYALQVDDEPGWSFTKGLSDVAEPDFWRLDLTGAIDTWAEVGLPDDRRVLKACGRASRVLVVPYGRTAAAWWQGIERSLRRPRNLEVLAVVEGAEALAALAARRMILHVNVQDGEVWVQGDNGDARVKLERWYPR